MGKSEWKAGGKRSMVLWCKAEGARQEGNRRETMDKERVLLAVHCLGDKGFPRILLVEIERRQGKKVVRNTVSFSGKGNRSLNIKPTKAKGWGKSNWSFADNNDEVGPLLLPWRDSAVRYEFVRNKGLVPRR